MLSIFTWTQSHLEWVTAAFSALFSTKDFNHARYMYDQLNVLSPIMLAMTAGSPFYKGKISDWDIRWKALCDSVDDRTPSERDPNSPDFLPNSRCSEASYYLWNN